jgi:hypothetical protein
MGFLASAGSKTGSPTAMIEGYQQLRPGGKAKARGYRSIHNLNASSTCSPANSISNRQPQNRPPTPNGGKPRILIKHYDSAWYAV